MNERRIRLSRYKQYELLKMFVAGVSTRAASEIVGVHRNTAAKFYMRLHQLIAGKLEADESYFGGVRKPMPKRKHSCQSLSKK